MNAKVSSFFDSLYEIVGKLNVDKTPQTMEAVEKKYETMRDGNIYNISQKTVQLDRK